MIFVCMGTVNSVNLADGLDGLVSELSPSLAFYTVLLIINNYGELAVFSSAITGACLGFLLFNRYPARVFMETLGFWLRCLSCNSSIFLVIFILLYLE